MSIQRQFNKYQAAKLAVPKVVAKKRTTPKRRRRAPRVVETHRAKMVRKVAERKARGVAVPRFDVWAVGHRMREIYARTKNFLGEVHR